MNAQRLLAYYERIADAPDAVPRFRRFILDMAVRGFLSVPSPVDAAARHDLCDFPSGYLADRESEPPFELPSGWTWKALSDVADQVTDGEHATPPRISQQEVPLVTAKNVRDGFMNYVDTDWVSLSTAEKAWKRCRPVVGDVLLVCVGATTGRVTVLREPRDMVLVRSVALIRVGRDVIPDYMEIAIRSPFVQEQIWASVKAAAQPCLYINRIKSLLIPVPPLAEQSNVVTKVKQLTALCDQIDAARAKREAFRDRLTAATFIRLNTPNPESFRDDACRALEALPALTARSDQIGQFRQSILGLAVRGRLLPHDLKDESAFELLKRVSIEKARLGSKTEIQALRAEELPFQLPQGWCWTRVGDICLKTGSGSTPRGGQSAYKEAGIPFLRSQNVYNEGLRLEDVAYIDQLTHARMAGTAVKPGDLLLNITGGSMGRCCRVPHTFGEANVSQHVAILRTALPGTEAFLHLAILSPYFQAFVFEGQTGAGRGGLPKNRMDRIPIPLPPLAEQRRIVATVNELMTHCDRLQVALTTIDDARSRLLSVLLRDALQFGATREKAA